MPALLTPASRPRVRPLPSSAALADGVRPDALLRRANAAILQLSLQYLRRGFLVLKGVPHRSQATSRTERVTPRRCPPCASSRWDPK